MKMMTIGNSLPCSKKEAEITEILLITSLDTHLFTRFITSLLVVDNAYRMFLLFARVLLIICCRQFFILPPYQRQSHASELYNAIRSDVLSRQEIIELGVEDPSEAFDVLRDVNDLRWLSDKHILDNKTAIDMDRKWIEQERQKLKVAKRQFLRLIEMILLHKLDPKNQEQSRKLRLLVSFALPWRKIN